MAMIPDIPEEIIIQLKRTAHISRKIIDRVPDENYDIDGNRVPPIFDIEQYPEENMLSHDQREPSSTWLGVINRNISLKSSSGWASKKQDITLSSMSSATFTVPFMESASRLFRKTSRIVADHSSRECSPRAMQQTLNMQQIQVNSRPNRVETAPMDDPPRKGLISSSQPRQFRPRNITRHNFKIESKLALPMRKEASDIEIIQLSTPSQSISNINS